MAAKTLCFLCTLWILVPPVLGTFVFPNDSKALTDWSMFSRFTGPGVCFARFDVSDDGKEWSPVDSRIGRGSQPSDRHLYRTPFFVNPQDAKNHLGIVCRARIKRFVRWSLSCYEKPDGWREVTKDDVVDCENPEAPSL